MMPHVMFRSDRKTYGLPCNMDGTWTTYYGKDFTRIVLELIGALEQTIAVEPLNGWRGANTNQSLKVLQWLYRQGHLLPITRVSIASQM